jgi:HlyD family secretion protein
MAADDQVTSLNSVKNLNYSIKDLRSESVRDIINSERSFMEKWAFLIFIIILGSLIFFLSFLRFPEVVYAKGRLLADNTPKELVAISSGRIERLNTYNGDTVQSGQILGWIESTANIVNVENLHTKIDTCIQLMDANQFNAIPEFLFVNIKDLGNLQESYEVFVNAYQKFRDNIIDGYLDRQKLKITKDLDYLEKLRVSLVQQRDLIKKDSLLTHGVFTANEKLYKEKVISMGEYNLEEIKLLGKKMQIPQITSSIILNDIQRLEKLKDLDQLEQNWKQDIIFFRQALLTLKNKIKEWQNQYLLKAPFSGTVNFVKLVQENQYVEKGTIIAYVVPLKINYFVEVSLGQYNLGKVNKEMPVQLRFEAYPFQELGYVQGRMDYISSVATDSGFIGTITLKNGLVTTRGTTIGFKNGLKTDVVIIAKEYNLIDRVFKTILPRTY